MKYPKYTREEKLNCKLTDDDIDVIIDLYSKGFTGKQLAQKFGVVKSTIYRYTNPEAAKRYDKKRYEWQKQNMTKEQKYTAHKKYKIRKKIINPQYKSYIMELKKEWENKNPDKKKLYNYKWYSKYGKEYYGKKRGYLKYL